MVRGVNKVGGKKEKKPRTTAKKDAHKVGRLRIKPKEREIHVDDSRTTFGKQKDKVNKNVLQKTPKKARKGKHEKVPGTKLQQNKKTGQVVRVVLESGKEFPPDSVWCAKQHMTKLKKERQEADEITKMRGEEVEALPEHLAKAEKKLDAQTKERQLNKGQKRKLPSAAATQPSQPSKKERKALEQSRRTEDQQKLKGERGERKLLLEDRVEAEVMRREKGFVWVKLLDSSIPQVPASLLQEIRKASAEKAGEDGASASAEDVLLQLWFFDVAQEKLNLQTGLQLSLRMYKDRHGFCACEAKAKVPTEAAQADKEESDPEA